MENEIKYFEKHVNVLKANAKMVETLKRELSPEDYDMIKQKGFDTYCDELKQAEFEQRIIRPEGHDISIIPFGGSDSPSLKISGIYVPNSYSGFDHIGMNNIREEVSKGTKLVITLPTSCCSKIANELRCDLKEFYRKNPNLDQKVFYSSCGGTGRNNPDNLSQYFAENNFTERTYGEARKKIISAESGLEALEIFKEFYLGKGSHEDMQGKFLGKYSSFDEYIESLKNIKRGNK